MIHSARRFLVDARHNENCLPLAVETPARNADASTEPVTIRGIPRGGETVLRTNRQIERLTRALGYIVLGFGQNETPDREHRRDS